MVSSTERNKNSLIFEENSAIWARLFKTCNTEKELSIIKTLKGSLIITCIVISAIKRDIKLRQSIKQKE